MKNRPLKLAALWLTILFLGIGCTTDSQSSEAEQKAEVEGMSGMNADLPDDLDPSTTRLTDDGEFEVTVESQLDPPVINEIHSWSIHVSDADGHPVEGAEIIVDGGMPQHNHGFPTEPRVTEELGDGDYLLEGVKFNMSGWWELKLDISAEGKSDSVVFNLMLP